FRISNYRRADTDINEPLLSFSHSLGYVLSVVSQIFMGNPLRKKCAPKIQNGVHSTDSVVRIFVDLVFARKCLQAVQIGARSSDDVVVVLLRDAEIRQELTGRARSGTVESRCVPVGPAEVDNRSATLMVNRDRWLAESFSDADRQQSFHRSPRKRRFEQPGNVCRILMGYSPSLGSEPVVPPRPSTSDCKRFGI